MRRNSSTSEGLRSHSGAIVLSQGGPGASLVAIRYKDWACGAQSPRGEDIKSLEGTVQGGEFGSAKEGP